MELPQGLVGGDFRLFFERDHLPKGSFRLERSRAERSKNRNKATAVTTKLQRSNALIFIEHTFKTH